MAVTTPSPDAFEYTNDSVVARVSVDVPSQALTDITQLSTAMGAMRTELEAIARAQGDWLDYLQQIPVIAERANQAYRDQITQLERISYIQNELGNDGADGGDGNVSPSTPMRSSGSPGAGGYSTAAPAGYANPFQGMVSGMGGGGGAAIADISGQLQSLAANDPRMVPNMASARGMAINPALLTALGGGIATMAAARKSGRTADSPPDPTEGGAPDESEKQHQRPPGSPGVGRDMMGTLMGGLQQGIAGELMSRFGGGRVSDLLGAVGGAAGLGGLFGGGKKDGDPGSGQMSLPFDPPLSGASKMAGSAAGLMGRFKSLGTLGKIGVGTGVVGAGMAAFNMAQDVGERITRLQMLGSEEGGDYATGLKEDIHARMIALDPMLSADQARKAIQLPMSAGFQGSSRDELRDLLINNFKELGVSMATSMSIEMSNLRGQELTDENIKKSRTSNEATMNVMKELAGDGGNTMALSERVEELRKLSAVLNSLGVSQGSAERSAIGWQEGFKDSLALRGEGSRIMGQTMASGTLMSMVANQKGITGILPDALPMAMEAAGMDSDEIQMEAAKMVAGYVAGERNYFNRIAMFKSLMEQNGVQLDMPQAKDLYERATGQKEDPMAKAAKAISAKKEKNQQGWNPIGAIGGFLTAPSWSEKIDALTGKSAPSQNADNVVDSFEQAGRLPGDLYAPAGRAPRQLPQNAAQASGQRSTVTAQGQVTGEVRITVDQQGRVSAPASIQLSGQQKAAFSGYGSAQLNNAPPGDPTYYHSYNPFPGGPG